MNDDAPVFPAAEETVHVEKRTKVRGRVKIRQTVREREETVDVPLLKEEVEVQRVPIGKAVRAAPSTRYEGDVMVIPRVEEVVRIEKRLVLVEELRIKKRRVETRESKKVKLRRQEVRVERT
jgi:uncharacterized protein (TIGR02271 family)